MGLFDRFLKSKKLPTKNPAIIAAVKQVQSVSSSYNEQHAGLTKLESLFLKATDTSDKMAISQSLLDTATDGASIQVRESSLTKLGTIIDKSIQFSNHPTLHSGASRGLSAISGHAVPSLIAIIENTRGKETELRRIAFWTLQKIAPFALDDALLVFLVRSLSEKRDIRMPVICALEDIARLSDDTTRKRMAEVGLSPLCQTLKDNDAEIWIRAARVLGDLGTYAAGSVNDLISKLDDDGGEWAADSLRKITGEAYGNKEKGKWQEWVSRNGTQ
ncbi:MAG TPA: hypothetical protein VMT62_16435 [Syntrophorhabdaceae bacterium]|nr:hypothetical protein [Syntrophorhabdaceae bacterium]